jgi:tetratricopeptide (TPR) repeat protein
VRSVHDLRERKDKLDDAMIVRLVDRETYQRKLDRLNEEITLAEMATNDAKLETFDVETVLNFAEHLILNAARLWTEFSSELRQRLQRVLFPEGVTFSECGFQTTASHLMFNLLQQPEAKKQIDEPHINLGNALFTQGKGPEAMAHYKEALRLKPDSAEAHTYLGLALEQMGRTPEAIQHYEQALKLRPHFAPAKNALTRLGAGQWVPRPCAAKAGGVRKAFLRFCEANVTVNVLQSERSQV